MSMSKTFVRLLLSSIAFITFACFAAPSVMAQDVAHGSIGWRPRVPLTTDVVSIAFTASGCLVNAAGSPMATGTLNFQIVDGNGNPASVGTGTSTIVTTSTVSVPIVAGTITSFNIPNPALTTLTPYFVHITLLDTSTNKVTNYPKVQVMLNDAVVSGYYTAFNFCYANVSLASSQTPVSYVVGPPGASGTGSGAVSTGTATCVTLYAITGTTVTGDCNVTDNGSTVSISEPVQIGSGYYHMNFITTGIPASWNFNAASPLSALESIGGHVQVNGSIVSNGVNPINFTSASMTPPAGNTNCTFYNVAQSVNCYVPTPTSASSLIAAPGNGYIFNITYNGNATTFPQGTNGDALTISGCTGAAQGVSANAPIYLKCPSGTTAGTGAAFIGNPVTASNGLPLLYFDYIISAFTDISSGNNFWGYCHTCTNTNLYVTSAPYAPTFPMAMITASTSAGDATFYCVTSDGTTVSRTAITGASLPTSGSSYPFQIVGTITVNASNVICTVNGVSVTKTTNLPTGALNSLAAVYVDIPTSTTAVNVGLNKEYAFYQPGGRSN